VIYFFVQYFTIHPPFDVAGSISGTGGKAMTTRRTILVCLQLTIVTLLIWGAAPVTGDSAAPANNSAATVDITARRLVHDLKREGYEAGRGYFKLYTKDDCPYSYEVLHSCLGNNPAAPYVLPIVPAWPDEWVDPGTAGLVGPTREGYNAAYRFDQHEAMVILGVLPPPARYFGLQTYLLSRPGRWDERSAQYQFVKTYVPALLNTFFTKLPKNDKRLELFADLSDPINNVVIENVSGDVWDQVRYFVITPDKAMDRKVRQALGKMGVNDSDIFTEQIPSDMNIGLKAKSDDFMTVLRYAMPDDGGGDGTPSQAWRESLPLAVLRIRDTRPGHKAQPYPPVEFEARYGTTPPEIALKPDLVTLAKAVCSRWGQACDDDTTFDQRVPPLLNMRTALSWTGPECVKVGMNCLAPNEDAAYFMSARMPLPDNRVYAVVGALGTQTGNATYVGLGLNSSLTQLGFDNIDDEALVGSADGYGVPNHGSFFLQYFARDCSGAKLAALTAGSACYSIGDLLPACTDPADLSCAMLVLSVRDYLFPGSQRGPDPAQTLSPRFIPLQRPPETN
jgi:hypothetical protein